MAFLQPVDSHAGSADATLVERTLHGDESAFAELIQRHEKAVLRKVHRILGRSSEDADAVQEVFLRVYSALHRFDVSRTFRLWLMRITSNYCIDQIRRTKSARIQVLSQMRESDRRRYDNTPIGEASPDCTWVIQPGFGENLLGMLMEELKPRYRAAIVMRELEGRDYADIARTLGVSLVNARVMVSRARKMMQQEFRYRLTA
jgi:RNA polymerase sigma-70 factor (ECF subfamily)